MSGVIKGELTAQVIDWLVIESKYTWWLTSSECLMTHILNSLKSLLAWPSID